MKCGVLVSLWIQWDLHLYIFIYCDKVTSYSGGQTAKTTVLFFQHSIFKHVWMKSCTWQTTYSKWHGIRKVGFNLRIHRKKCLWKDGHPQIMYTLWGIKVHLTSFKQQLNRSSVFQPWAFVFSWKSCTRPFVLSFWGTTSSSLPGYPPSTLTLLCTHFDILLILKILSGQLHMNSIWSQDIEPWGSRMALTIKAKPIQNCNTQIAGCGCKAQGGERGDNRHMVGHCTIKDKTYGAFLGLIFWTFFLIVNWAKKKSFKFLN